MIVGFCIWRGFAEISIFLLGHRFMQFKDYCRKRVLKCDSIFKSSYKIASKIVSYIYCLVVIRSSLVLVVKVVKVGVIKSGYCRKIKSYK